MEINIRLKNNLLYGFPACSTEVQKLSLNGVTPSDEANIDVIPMCHWPLLTKLSSLARICQ